MKTKSTKNKAITKVFVYKGVIGILSDVKSEGLLNKPEQPGQLGFVLEANKVQFSKEAKKLLKTIKKSGDSIGDVDCFKSTSKGVIFSFLGGPLKAFKPGEVEGARDTNFNLLDEFPDIDIEIPKQFKEFVDKK